MSPILRRAARKFITSSTPHIPLSVFRQLFPRDSIGFFYHLISDEPVPHVRNLYAIKSTREFELDLRWLKSNTRLVGYEDLVTHFRDGAPLPPHAAYLSFDDGFAECFHVIRPILLRYQVPAIFFLTANWIDNQGMFYRSKVSLAIEHLLTRPAVEWSQPIENLALRYGFEANLDGFTYWIKSLKQSDEPVVDEICNALKLDIDQYLREKQPYLTTAQVRQMQAEGFTFGAHSCRHAKLATLTPEVQEWEIVESCRIVASITGQDRVPFAFPFSGTGVSRALLRKIQKNNPIVEAFFDTQKLLRERGIAHRIWVDKPVPGIKPAENIPYWLHEAYRRASVRRTMR